MNNGVSRKQILDAIDKFQIEHPVSFPFDAVSFRDKQSVDIIEDTVKKIMLKVEEDNEYYIICKMAKLYLEGVKPTYNDRPTGKWVFVDNDVGWDKCSNCNWTDTRCHSWNYCPNCGARMEEKGDIG